MKPCDKCAWEMTRGGVCAKCSHADDDIPVGVVVALVVMALAVIGLGFGVWALAS